MSGHARLDDRELALGVGIIDPVIETAALQRVVDFAGAVRGDDDDRRLRRLDGAEFGDRDLEVAEDFQQIRLERLVGAVEFVDQQHRRAGDVRLQRLQQRPLDQKALGENVAMTTGRDRYRRRLPPAGSRSSAPRCSTHRRRRQRPVPRSIAGGSAFARAPPTAPLRFRSCRRRPRLRETAAGPCAATDRSPSPATARRDSRARSAVRASHRRMWAAPMHSWKANLDEPGIGNVTLWRSRLRRRGAPAPPIRCARYSALPCRSLFSPSAGTVRCRRAPCARSASSALPRTR